jgi:hypothetical protein
MLALGRVAEKPEWQHGKRPDLGHPGGSRVRRRRRSPADDHPEPDRCRNHDQSGTSHDWTAPRRACRRDRRAGRRPGARMGVEDHVGGEPFEIPSKLVG